MSHFKKMPEEDGRCRERGPNRGLRKPQPRCSRIALQARDLARPGSKGDGGSGSRGHFKIFATSYAEQTERIWTFETAPGDEKARLIGVRVRPEYGTSHDPITVSTPFVIEIDYWILQPGQYVSVDVIVINEQEITVCEIGPDHAAERRNPSRSPGLYRTVCHVPGELLNDRMHRLVINLQRARPHSSRSGRGRVRGPGRRGYEERRMVRRLVGNHPAEVAVGD